MWAESTDEARVGTPSEAWAGNASGGQTWASQAQAQPGEPRSREPRSCDTPTPAPSPSPQPEPIIRPEPDPASGPEPGLSPGPGSRGVTSGRGPGTKPWVETSGLDLGLRTRGRLPSGGDQETTPGRDRGRHGGTGLGWGRPRGGAPPSSERRAPPWSVLRSASEARLGSPGVVGCPPAAVSPPGPRPVAEAR
jgi:hypothetical protein